MTKASDPLESLRVGAPVKRKTESDVGKAKMVSLPQNYTGSERETKTDRCMGGK
jgi:hypothetical protein